MCHMQATLKALSLYRELIQYTLPHSGCEVLHMSFLQGR